MSNEKGRRVDPVRFAKGVQDLQDSVAEMLQGFMPHGPFLAEEVKAFKAFRELLEHESDRACALMAAAYLDDRLKQAFVAGMLPSKNLDRDLFEGSAPLATFSARTRLARAQGLISETTKRDLDLLRKIRNAFAHVATPLSFEDPKIRSMCMSLEHGIVFVNVDDARRRFINTMTAIAGDVAFAISKARPPIDIPASSSQERQDLMAAVVATVMDSIRDAPAEP